MNLLPVAILAGGLATRMLPLTEKIPKSLLKVGNEPFLVHQLRLLEKNGFSDVVICIGHLGSMIENVIQEYSFPGMKIIYSREGEELLGTGGAIKKAIPLLGERFLTLYGDSYLPIDYHAICQKFMESKKACLMTVYKNNNKLDRSNIVYKDGYIIRYDKKETVPEMEYIDYGLCGFSSSQFNGSNKNKFDLSEILSQAIELNEVLAIEVEGRFFEIGSKSGFEELCQVMKKNSDR